MKKPATVTGDGGGTGGTLDLISRLPDEILVRILSLLPTTKAAVRTCVVSKRWRFLWTSIDKLNLHCNTKAEADKLVSFMNYVFDQRLNVKKLYLECRVVPIDNFHVNKLLAFLVENKVEHIVLKSPFFKEFNLPKFFYTCSSLVKLDLCNCVFDKEAIISWKSLKSVKFMTVMLDNESIVKLLSGCPVLESLELSFFRGFRRLEVKNTNLKTIKLNFWPFYEREGWLEIVAPYLQHLGISGRRCEFKCRLKNVSSLVSAELTFSIKCEFRGGFGNDGVERCRKYHQGFWALVQDYLRKLKHVSELTIGTWFAEVLFRLQLDRVQLPELQCRHLTLKLYVAKWNLCGVATLLRALPYLETLNINMGADVDCDHVDCDCSHCNFESSYLHEGEDIDLENWIPSFEFPNLKTVNIICSCGTRPKELHDKLFELSEILLKKAMVLEKFLIIAKRGKCCFCRGNCVCPYSSRLAAKLSDCPRSSTNCTMIFREFYLP